MNKGIIKEVREDGTALIIAPIEMQKYIKQGIKECYVDFIDSRTLSDKQRRMCYALINAIADYTGEERESEKNFLKLEFMAERIESLGDKVFSLANAPMSLVAEFQRYLVAFILNNDIPLKFPLKDYVDDIDHYVYMCLINKKCAICGKRAELHHIDTVGMGNDRTQVQHEGRECMSLCTDHHKEFHNLGKATFLEKYHLNKGVEIDKTLLKIYGLRR
jgi:hypothetical protein